MVPPSCGVTGWINLKVSGIDPGARTFLTSMDLDGEVMLFCQMMMRQALCDSLYPR